MTVKEMIELLNAFDENAEVCMYDYEWGDYGGSVVDVSQLDDGSIGIA